MKPIKICFNSLRSYPLFESDSLSYFGGAEVQISLLARQLAKDKNLNVSLITGDYGQPTIIKFGRLTIYKTKLFDFLFLLKKINADVYVERTINPKIMLVALFCRLFHKKFIYMVAHDWDLKHKIINLADLIITQHNQQKISLKYKSLLMPSLIKNPFFKKISKRKFILWVGRADAWKKPLDFIHLASHYPKEKFVMICRPGKVDLPPALPNLKIIPAVAPSKIIDFFSQAKILVNTSIAEGFPNTFLQAGITKTPVLSFQVNPENYLNRYRCGLVGRNRFEQLLKNPSRLKVFGQNHFNYVVKYHSLKNAEIVKQALYKL